MMVVCHHCKHEQASGKFCEACGQPIESQEAAAGIETNADLQTGNSTRAAAAHIGQSSQQTGNTENVLVEYWHYFLTLSKNPTKAFQGNESQFSYGLITMGLYSLLFSLGLYFFANSMFKSYGGILAEGSSIPFSITFRLLIFIVVILAVAFFSAFAILKMCKSTDSFQTIIAQFGGLLVPFTILQAIGFLGGVTDSPVLTLIPILIALSFTISYVPVLLVFEKSASLKAGSQKVYLSFVTVLIISFLFFILGRVWLVEFLDDLQYMIDSPF